MFKIDWPCAIGGVVLGYYTKGKVESAKTNFKGIYTNAVNTIKESFSEDSEKPQSGTQAGTQGKQG